MKLIVWFLFFLLGVVLVVIGLNYTTEFSDLSYPAKIGKVDYKSCIFTIRHSSNIPKSKDYGIEKVESLPLLGIESLSEQDCKCVEDALQFHAKSIQQFKYVDYPFFVVGVNNNKFDISIEVKDYIGTKILHFNDIVYKNKNNLCQKWRY